MTKHLKVIALWCDDGKVQPLAWTVGPFSKRQLRKATRKFRHDADVVKPCVMHWARLYRSPKDMMAELPRY